MFKYLLIVAVACSSILAIQVKADEVCKDELIAYIEGCKKGLSQAKPNWDHKDIEMLCSDPYLQGKANESDEDKSRRMSLINKTNEDKKKMLLKLNRSKDEIKPCFDAYLAIDPSKDLKDIKMLCLNPYLTPTPNESSDDQVRRKRLIAEFKKNLESAFSKHNELFEKKEKSASGVK